jgi:hypothetical protein
MIRLSVFGIAIFFLTTLATAQTTLGPKLGLNISTLSGNERSGLTSKVGFNVGAFFNFKINDLIAVQPEVYFTMKGAKDTTIETEIHNFTYTLDYIEIPVLIKFSIPIPNSKFCPSVYVGPSVSFNLNAKVSEEINGTILEGDYEFINKTDYGLILGTNMGFRSKKFEYGLDIRYVMGLRSIYNTQEYSYDVKNHVFSLSFYFASSI